MLKTIDRLMKFIAFAGLSARQFDLSIGAANGYTLRMRKNNASIGSDVIENIINVYPQINVEWLITGKGEMLKEQDDFSFDYDKLPLSKKIEIEKIIEEKIKAKHQLEIKQLLKEVTDEISKTQKKN